MDPDRAKATRLALEEINRHRGEYNTREKQEEMLATLIETNNLKDAADQRSEQVDLTVKKYREWMGYTVKHDRGSFKNGVPKIKQVFLEGSSRLGQEFLTKTGFQKIQTPQINRRNEEVNGVQSPHRRSGGTIATAAAEQHLTPIQGDIDGLRRYEDGAEVAETPNSFPMSRTPEINLMEEPDVDSDDSSRVQNGHKQWIGTEYEELNPGFNRELPHDRNEQHSSHLTPEPFHLVDNWWQNPGQDDVSRPSENMTSTRSSRTKRKAGDEPEVAPQDRTAPKAPKLPAPEVQTPIVDEDTSLGVTASQKASEEQGSEAALKSSLSSSDDCQAEKQKSIEEVSDQEQMQMPQPTTQPQPPQPATSASAKQSGVEINPLDYHMIEPMHGKDMQEKLRDFRSCAQTFAYDVLEGTGVDISTPADCVPEPAGELKTLYQRIFGDRWKETAFHLSQTEFSVTGLLQALLCAAIYRTVFEQELPWMGPDEAAELLRDFQPYLDWAFSEYSNHHPAPKFRTVLWRASKYQFEMRKFEDEQIKPHALELAQSFMLTINPQLRAISATTIVTGEKSSEFWRHKTSLVAEAFTSALILRGRMRCSRYYYERKWAHSSEIVDREWMEETRDSERPNRVRWCIYPAIWVRQSRDAELELVGKALVASHKKSNLPDDL